MPSNPFYGTNALSNDVSHLLSEYINEKFPYGSRSIHPEEITECGRKIAYRTTLCMDDEKSFNKLEGMANKSAIERWIRIFNETKGFRVLDKNVLASDHNYNMVSFIDCVVEFKEYDDAQVVFCIKSVSSDDFKLIKENGPFRKDIVRANVDLWLIELGKCIFLYENRDTFEFITFYIEPSISILNSVRGKAKTLVEYKANGEIPPRPYKTKDSKECQSCKFLEICWE